MVKSSKIGIMSGRLSEKIDDRIQIFPINSWKEEFEKASKLGFDLIEWIFDIVPNKKIAFFEVSWSTSDYVDGDSVSQQDFIKKLFNFYRENESKIEFFTISRLFDKPKGSCVSQDIQSVDGSGFASNSFRLERVDEYVCNSGLIDTNQNIKSSWTQIKTNIPN